MKLSELLKYDNIVIQCHNYPDADTIASGYGLYCYLTFHKKNCVLIYGGNKKISKSNLLIMIEKLSIPIKYAEKLDEKTELLITVDCVHEESNTADFGAENYAAVDHHASVYNKSPMYDIRPSYGSCSSVIAVLLKEAGYDFNTDEKLATALYYGLYTDTDEMKELSHPADRDLRDFAKYNKAVFSLLINSNLSLSELRIAGDALNRINCNNAHHCAVVRAEECDPNILGFISDLVIKVDSVKASVVCCKVSGGIKFSVRSCVKEINAAELAEFIADNIGSGGGHCDKAGGFINMRLAAEKHTEIDPYEPTAYFNERISEYFECVDIIDVNSYEPDLSVMKTYTKKRIILGFVKSTDIFPAGTSFVVRTLEADFNVEADDNVYIMIDDEGNIYPIEREKFSRTYSLSDKIFKIDGEYSPSIISASYGQHELLTYAKSCIPNTSSNIYAVMLNRRVKLYTLWDKENYMSGKPGDYLAIRTDDLKDMYIISGRRFSKIYEQTQ